MKNIICFFLISLFGISCNINSSNNYEDLKKIEIGMSIIEVDKIMRNNPIKLDRAIYNDSKIIEYYESPMAASDYFQIVYSSNDSIVVEIYFGD